MGSRAPTYLGVFAVAMATLVLEILATRITSVVAWYHLAFFVISLAMLGMTAGAVIVFIRPKWFPDEAIQDTVLVARFDEMNGHTVWSSSSRRNGVSIGMLDGPAEVTIEIPQLPLLEGTFDLTVAITNQTEIQPYDWWDRRVRFDVRQFTSLDSGITHIPSEWTITGAKNIVQLG